MAWIRPAPCDIRRSARIPPKLPAFCTEPHTNPCNPTESRTLPQNSTESSLAANKPTEIAPLPPHNLMESPFLSTYPSKSPYAINLFVMLSSQSSCVTRLFCKSPCPIHSTEIILACCPLTQSKSLDQQDSVMPHDFTHPSMKIWRTSESLTSSNLKIRRTCRIIHFIRSE